MAGLILEKTLEKKCKKYTEDEGGMLIKLLPFSMGGLPDRLCILPDRPMFFIELKKPGGKITAEEKRTILQKAVHRLLLKLGQRVYTVDNYETFKILLKYHLTLPKYDFGATS